MYLLKGYVKKVENPGFNVMEVVVSLCMLIIAIVTIDLKPLVDGKIKTLKVEGDTASTCSACAPD